MSLVDLLKKNRTYRRFHEDQPVGRDMLVGLVDGARYCASSANRQALKFIVASEPEEWDLVFPHLEWASSLEWTGPVEGERPTCYIILLGDREIHPSVSIDPGIVAQTMMLLATEQGYGGCMFGAVDRKHLRIDLQIPKRFKIELVMAFGRPAETVVLEEVTDPKNFDYWRDANDVHHVPKRPLSEILVDFRK